MRRERRSRANDLTGLSWSAIVLATLLAFSSPFPASAQFSSGCAWSPGAGPTVSYGELSDRLGTSAGVSVGLNVDCHLTGKLQVGGILQADIYPGEAWLLRFLPTVGYQIGSLTSMSITPRVGVGWTQSVAMGNQLVGLTPEGESLDLNSGGPTIAPGARLGLGLNESLRLFAQGAWQHAWLKRESHLDKDVLGGGDLDSTELDPSRTGVGSLSLVVGLGVQI